MKIVTFNIRRDVEQDGINRFDSRKEMIFRKIMTEKPDIICFQEVLPHVLKWLKDVFLEYDIAGCGRDKFLKDEATVIAYKKSRFNMIQMDTFWLSETPSISGSRYSNQSLCPRTCNMALMHDLQTDEIFRIYNTHLDHEGSDARKLGIHQILMRMKTEILFPEAPIIFLGDFNATPDEAEMKFCFEHADLIDLTDGMEGSFHEYGTLQVAEKIDYILAGKEWKLTERGMWKDCKGGIFLSDHYPVFVEIYT